MLREIAYKAMRHPIGLRAIAEVLCRSSGCVLRREGDTFLLIRGHRRIRLASKHLLFSIDTARHFDTYFGQVQPTNTDGGLEVDYSAPKLHTLVNGMRFELSSMPEELPTLDSYFRFYRPQPGDLVFDIGAYCGVFTRELSGLVGPAGRVIAFEPDPLNVALLRRNVARHNLSNVTVAQVALSDSEGSAQFNSDGSLGSALTRLLDRPPTNETVTVQTITLENACRDHGVPTFIKIDAEGAEIEILSGALEFIHKNRMHFVLDTNHIRGGVTTHSHVENLFHACGYATESSTEFGGFMTTWAYKPDVGTS